ncbi:Aste57867_16063 [Aphanomyces stellatus]|uniref:Aste57867_16063 protein n=1 Tax=Aphanomyces stellatus TaxID=120398 RepID=A0A485L4S0_9STRA|nr:hypothetical protein As57867_016007 [Aphanomyces stellatus]VFT92847.1 Aste57867_16063 [Aphanomyces stellatus]
MKRRNRPTVSPAREATTVLDGRIVHRAPPTMDAALYRDLLQKYENIATVSPPSYPTLLHDTQTAAATSHASSAPLTICMQCQGLRIEKMQYNYMVLDQTCAGCDGEGVVKNAR